MKILSSISDLDEALKSESPVMLFKHSTRCPISTFADDNYKKFVDESNSDVLFTHLDLIAHRDVSNAIAERTGVTHQSPQAILLVDGKVTWQATHTAITVEALSDAVGGIK